MTCKKKMHYKRNEIKSRGKRGGGERGVGEEMEGERKLILFLENILSSFKVCTFIMTHPITTRTFYHK